jgi:hypothetical protein
MTLRSPAAQPSTISGSRRAQLLLPPHQCLPRPQRLRQTRLMRLRMNDQPCHRHARPLWPRHQQADRLLSSQKNSAAQVRFDFRSYSTTTFVPCQSGHGWQAAQYHSHARTLSSGWQPFLRTPFVTACYHCHLLLLCVRSCSRFLPYTVTIRKTTVTTSYHCCCPVAYRLQ